MKLKQCLYLLIFCCLLSMSASANSGILPNRMEITMFANDEPFTMPQGREKEPRSLPMAISFSAFLNDDKSVDIYFYQEIGEIEIIISQNGSVVYSFTENVEYPIVRNIKLSQELSGSFLLEVKNDGGAYTFGNIDL